MRLNDSGHRVWLLASLVLAFLSPIAAIAAATGETVLGVASVIDGDTLDIHGERFRIEGIDAPESNQLCQRQGDRWPCGRRSATALADFIGASTVKCTVLGLDKYRRNLGRCFARDRDIADLMTREGWAIAYRKYSMDYVAAEEEAHTQRRNLWAGEFEAPWDFRHRRRGGPRQ